MLLNKKDAANQFIRENQYKINPQYRLKYHLMSEYGWLNDPNGFIQYKGQYHLFYQCHPYDAAWGPMHWGHAVSKDLIKWSYLPIALAPEEDYDRDGCFSGSAIAGEDRLYLLYTGHVNTQEDGKNSAKEVQCLAYSEDGVNFVKHSDNPVIDENAIPAGASKRDFRDPKVFQEENQYYCVIGSNNGQKKAQVLLYKSLDLIHWEFVNVAAKGDKWMGENWECPDLFLLQEKHILILSPQYMKAQGNEYNNLHSSIYMIGKLDREKGKFNFNEYFPIDHGFDFYAPQTTLDHQGRRVLVAWMDMWEEEYPTQKCAHNWAGAMTLPREIIRKENKLYFNPISEIESYRKNQYAVEEVSLTGEKTLNSIGDSYELQVLFDAQSSSEFGLKIRANDIQETVLYYDRKNELFVFNRDSAGMGPKGERKTKVSLINNRLHLRIFVDQCSVEVFINHGEKVMTGRIYPDQDAVKIKAFSKEECKIEYLKKWDLE